MASHVHHVTVPPVDPCKTLWGERLEGENPRLQHCHCFFATAHMVSLNSPHSHLNNMVRFAYPQRAE